MPILTRYKPDTVNDRKVFDSIVSDIFKGYNMSYDKVNPIFKGGFSVLFKVPGHTDRLLRIEYVEKNRELANELIATTMTIEDKLGHLVPKTFGIKVFPLNDVEPTARGCIIVSEIERLDIVDWYDWDNHFDSPEHFAHVYLSVFEEMAKAHLYHSDISPNNIVLTRDGNIKVIDYLESCISNDKSVCYHMPIAHTYGYYDVTMYEMEADDVMLDTHENVFGKLDGRLTTNIPKVKWSPTMHLRYMLYGCGALLISILLKCSMDHFRRKKYADRYDALPDVVKKSIRNLITMGNRKLIVVPYKKQRGHRSVASRQTTGNDKVKTIKRKKVTPKQMSKKAPRVAQKRKTPNNRNNCKTPQRLSKKAPRVVRTPRRTPKRKIPRRTAKRKTPKPTPRRKTKCNVRQNRYKTSDGTWTRIEKGPNGGKFIYNSRGRKQYVKC